jgi:polyhydroxyalkanoate synthesis regulator phasin
MQSSHNAWLAVLEHFGFLTRKEAEHLANEIKNSIGSENYEQTYDLIKGILDKGEIKAHSIFTELEDKVKALEAKVTTIKVPDLNVLEAKVKMLENQLADKNKKVVDSPNKAM